MDISRTPHPYLREFIIRWYKELIADKGRSRRNAISKHHGAVGTAQDLLEITACIGSPGPGVVGGGLAFPIRSANLGADEVVDSLPGQIIQGIETSGAPISGAAGIEFARIRRIRGIRGEKNFLIIKEWLRQSLFPRVEIKLNEPPIPELLSATWSTVA